MEEFSVGATCALLEVFLLSPLATTVCEFLRPLTWSSPRDFAFQVGLLGLGEACQSSRVTEHVLGGICQGHHFALLRTLLPIINVAWLGRLLRTASVGGWRKGIKLLLSLTQRREERDCAVQGACQGGHIAVAQQLFELGHSDMGGHKPMIRWLMKRFLISSPRRQSHVWNYGLAGACEGGHHDIALLMISHGASSWNCGMMGAATGQCAASRELLSWMILLGADDWDLGLIGACQGNNVEVAKQFIARGASWFSLGLARACEFDAQKTLQLMADYVSGPCKNCGSNHGVR